MKGENGVKHLAVGVVPINQCLLLPCLGFFFSFSKQAEEAASQRKSPEACPSDQEAILRILRTCASLADVRACVHWF